MLICFVRSTLVIERGKREERERGERIRSSVIERGKRGERGRREDKVDLRM